MAGMCRLCASQKERLITLNYQWEAICEKLSICCHLHINKKDDLPKSVCQECMERLNKCYEFYTQVQEAQGTLQAMFSKYRYEGYESFKETLQQVTLERTLDGIHNRANVYVPKIVITKQAGRRRIRKAPSTVIKMNTDIGDHIEQLDDHTKDYKFSIANVTSLVPFHSNDVQVPEEYILPEPTDIKKEERREKDHSTSEKYVEHHKKESKMTLHKVKQEPAESEIDEVQGYNSEHEESGYDKDVDITDIKKDSCNLSKEKQITSWHSYIYPCYICEYSAFNFHDFIIHVDRMHSVRDFNELQYKCYDCKKVFSLYNAFLTHVRLKHHPALKLRCDACDILCPDFNTYVVHRNIICTEAKQYPCNFPQRKHRDQLPRKTYKCTICNKEFVQKRSLINHKHIKQRKKYTIPGTKYHCGICNKEFTQIRGLTSHQLNHMKEQEVVCDYCGEIFSTMANLEIHLPTHDSDTEFQCHICQKSFTKFSFLEKHRKNVHNDYKKFKCGICTKSFRTKVEKITHEGDKHADEMPFPCVHCDRRFRWRCQLDVHLAVHSNDRKHTCKYCNKSVKDGYYLKTHEKTCWARVGEDIKQSSEK